MRGVNASARPPSGRQEALILRPPILLLVAVLAVAIVLVGCPKPADQGTTPTTPTVAKGATAKAPSEKPVESPSAATVTLTDPSGQSLVLKAGSADEAFLKGLGLTAYPKAKPYTLDIDATVNASIEAEKKKAATKMTESQERAARELVTSVFTGKNAFFETEDSLENVRNWATENLKGWTVGDIKEEDGVKNFEIAKEELKEKVVCGVVEFSGKRYMMVVEAPSEPPPAPKSQ